MAGPGCRRRRRRARHLTSTFGRVRLAGASSTPRPWRSTRCAGSAPGAAPERLARAHGIPTPTAVPAARVREGVQEEAQGLQRGGAAGEGCAWGLSMGAGRVSRAAAGIVEKSGGDPDAVRLVKKGLRQARGARGGAAGSARPDSRIRAAKGSKWKQQSEALREAMRASRMVTQAQAEGRCVGRPFTWRQRPPPHPSPPPSSFLRSSDLRDIPATPSAEPSDYKQCPHCGRTFNPDAADRHIPRCANEAKRVRGVACSTAAGPGRGAPLPGRSGRASPAAAKAPYPRHRPGRRSEKVGSELRRRLLLPLWLHPSVQSLISLACREMVRDEDTQRAVDDIEAWRQDPRDMHLPSGPGALQLDPMYLFPIIATSMIPVVRTALRCVPVPRIRTVVPAHRLRRMPNLAPRPGAIPTATRYSWALFYSLWGSGLPWWGGKRSLRSGGGRRAATRPPSRAVGPGRVAGPLL